MASSSHLTLMLVGVWTCWVGRYSASMRDDGMTPYLWESGQQATDMVSRLRRVINEAGQDLKQIATTVAMEDAIRKRKGQFRSKLKLPPTEREEEGSPEDETVIDEEDEGTESSTTHTPWHNLIQLILT